MEPKSFGKKLGIGMRVAGNIARERAEEARRKAAQSPVAQSGTVGQSTQARSSIPEVLTQQAQQAAERSRNLGQGLGRGTRQFKKSFFGPLASASSVLWLEITGCFFALFAAFFGQNVYRVRAQYLAGPEHKTFLLYCLLTAIFLYFSGSSFVKARRRARRQAAGR